MRYLKLAFRGSANVWLATAALFLLSWILLPRTLEPLSLGVMLPFAAILAVAAVGQTLVIQQRGVDLSTGALISPSAALASRSTDIISAILIPILVCTFIGLVSGFFISYFKVTPLIATLAMAGIISGVVIAITRGTTSPAPEALSSFATSGVFGIPGTAIIAILVVLLAAGFLVFTTGGRKFTAVGSNELSSRAVGIRTVPYVLLAYAAAGLFAAIAGILLAGYVSTPAQNIGNEYTLPAIAAVIVGGTSIGGGRGRMIGTAGGALFLSQLNQLVLSLGAPNSIQLIVQGIVIAVAAAIQPEGRAKIAQVVHGIIGWIKRRTRKLPNAG